MRAAPAFQVLLCRFGTWQAAVWTLVCLGWSALLAWILTHEEGLQGTRVLLAVATGAAAWRIGSSLTGLVPIELSWDGQSWWLEPVDKVPTAGHLSVVIDLGPWMLLRFVPSMSQGRGCPRWLPVQRRGLEVEWHGLRCSVYSPVPTAPPGAMTAPEVASPGVERN